MQNRALCSVWVSALLLLGVTPVASAQTDVVTPPSVIAPKLLETREPVYPEAERASGRSATVVLELLLDAQGKVSEAKVTESAGAEFDAAALEAARQLGFEPAFRNGKAVPAKIPFRFDFTFKAPEPEPAPDPEPAKVPDEPDTRQVATPPLVPADEGIEIEVEGERPPREPTKRVLAAEEITKIPGTNGDALRSIGNMPGVARPPGLAGLLIVRGSSPLDTQVFMDGTNVPIVYHFGGLSSVVPSEMLERIDFYPGNFGPQYGRAMGGVIDVGIRSPRKDRLGGLLQVDLLDMRILAEGPIAESTRFMIGARRSWVDAWLGPAMREAGIDVSVAPVYYDYQAMLEHDLTRDTTVRLFAFGSDDRMELALDSPDASDPSLGGDAGLHTRFYRIQGRVDTRVNEDIRWTSTVSYGMDGQAVSIGNMNLDLNLKGIQGRSDLRMKLAREVTAVAGIDAHWTSYDVGWRFPAVEFEEGEGSGPLFGRPLNEVHGTGSVFRPAAYAMLELTPVSGLKLFPGVRADYHSDTEAWTLDPRLGVRYDLHSGFPRTTLKGGVGVFHQPPEPYESIKPFGTPGVASNRSLHYSVGIEQELSRPLEVSVEGFYKDLDNLVVPVPAAETSQNGFAHENFGSGRSFGTEFLLRYKPLDRFFGWVAYTISRSERRDSDAEEYSRFQYDQTHIFTALGSLKLGRGWQVGARFRYVTGSPYTPNIGGVMDYDAGAYAPIQSPQQYSRRLPAFHQLDLRVDKTWKFQAWQLSAYLDLQNAYNHQTSESVSYNYNYTKSSVVKGLPLLPIIGLRGEL